MKHIAIVGGGLAGLSAAWDLQKKGYKITVLEKEAVLGGLASGFRFSGWRWYAERTVHHIFKNDKDILDFAKEIGFSDVFFKRPLTGSLYKTNNNSRIFPLDSPQSFLKFPYLSLLGKLRSGFVLAFLKISPFLQLYERVSSIEFIRKTMGEESYQVMWETLFRKKFGKYAEKVLASFFWARIKKRTADLGYFRGGFQNFIDYLAKKLLEKGVKIDKKTEVLSIEKKGKGFVLHFKKGRRVQKLSADAVIFALQLPLFLKLSEKILPSSFVRRARSIKYLNAISLAVESEKPMVKDFYWVNNCVEDYVFTGIFQHTNFVDKRFYGKRHFGYVGWYCDFSDRVWQMSDKELWNFVLPYILEINPDFNPHGVRYEVFKAAFAQPIFDENFLKAELSVLTPVEGLFFAGFELSYPYDRGTNYAVKVGRKAAEFVSKSLV